MEKLRKVLRQSLKEAGRILKAGLNEEKKIEFKGHINLVTQVDKAAEKKIVSLIRKSFPNHLILAEETPTTPETLSPTRGNQVKWIIDPLDGTTNFAHELPMAGVSIGVEVGGQVVLGGVYEPFHDELFWAERGKGSVLNGKKIRVSRVGKLSEALLVTGFAYDVLEEMDRYLAYFKAFMARTQGVRRLGSAALDLCYVASGRLDGYWEYHLKPWDMAAGQLVLKEAGGRITQVDGSPFSVYGPSLLATNTLIHKEMTDVCQSVSKS